MADIPALVASIDTRLDQLAAQISTLEDARAALQARTIIAAPAAAPAAGAATNPARRPAPQTTKPATEAARPALVAAPPELGAASATGAKTKAETTEPRRRAAARSIRGRRSGSSLSADRLRGLLADARSGLSAGAIAQQAGASYNRVLAQLRELESAGTVRRTASRRSTLWLLVTDEERIAQRAAELEGLVDARRQDRTQRRGRARVHRLQPPRESRRPD
jgi:hypothetical protein